MKTKEIFNRIIKNIKTLFYYPVSGKPCKKKNGNDAVETGFNGKLSEKLQNRWWKRKQVIKTRNMWVEFKEYVVGKDVQFWANLSAFLTFIIFIFKGIVIGVIDFFKYLRSEYLTFPDIYVDIENGEKKIFLLIPIERKDKNEFTINTTPSCEFNTYQQILFFKYNITPINITTKIKHETTNQHLKMHIFKYELSHFDLILLKTRNVEAVFDFKIVNNKKDFKKTYDLSKTIGKREHVFKMVVDRFYDLVNYKSDLTTEEIQKKYGLTPPEKETE